MQPQLLYHTLHPDVIAFSTTRKGGVSKGNYAEFNLNLYCGDNEQNIAINRSSLCEELHVDNHHLLVAHQVHSIKARIITKEFFTLPASTQSMLLEGVDAMITNMHKVCIGVSTADCIPILLYDENLHVAAAIHAGWRGTLQRIVQRTIHTMTQTYNCHPQDLHACIGPGISLAYFEIGEEVYQAFSKAGFNMTSIAQKFDKWHINLPKCNQQQLLDMGVKEKNIIDTGICTYSRSDDFFSARRLGVNSGRIYNGIILR